MVFPDLYFGPTHLGHLTGLTVHIGASQLGLFGFWDPQKQQRIEDFLVDLTPGACRCFIHFHSRTRTAAMGSIPSTPPPDGSCRRCASVQRTCMIILPTERSSAGKPMGASGSDRPRPTALGARVVSTRFAAPLCPLGWSIKQAKASAENRFCNIGPAGHAFLIQCRPLMNNFNYPFLLYCKTSSGLGC